MAAHSHDLDPAMVVALSYTESRFSRVAVSSRGAVGPLQIKPVFHCPKGVLRDCDLIEAGMGAIIRFKKKRGRQWLCHWNSGNRCNRRSRLFAKIVKRRTRQLGGN